VIYYHYAYYTIIHDVTFADKGRAISWKSYRLNIHQRFWYCCLVILR